MKRPYLMYAILLAGLYWIYKNKVAAQTSSLSAGSTPAPSVSTDLIGPAQSTEVAGYMGCDYEIVN